MVGCRGLRRCWLIPIREDRKDAGFQLIISKRDSTCVRKSPEHIATAKRMKADGHTGKDIAKYLGVSRATLYRYLASERAA